MNPHEDRAREHKAGRLLAAIIRERLTLDDVECLNAEGWIALSERAGVRSPSFRTLEILVEQIEWRERKATA